MRCLVSHPTLLEQEALTLTSSFPLKKLENVHKKQKKAHPTNQLGHS